MSLFNKELKILNIGLEIFAEALTEQGAGVLQVDWQPTESLGSEVEEILDDLL
jgi:hypothetical protein